MDLTFEYNINEVVHVQPDDLMAKYGHDKMISYSVVSRIYEELSQEGNGCKSYVVRHIDPTTPGGGKLYKFSESELISKKSYMALMEVTGKNEVKVSNYASAIPALASWSTIHP